MAKTMKKSAKKAAPKSKGVAVFVATRKGAWIFSSDGTRKKWKINGPHFLGHAIHHMMLDPRDGKTLLATGSTGHLGPTIFRSTDFGKTWKEAQKPPAFAKVPEGEKGPSTALGTGRTVKHNFWLTPCHANEPNSWYVGTSPQGLFRSDDGGVTWEPLPGVNENATMRPWFGTEQDGTPDGPKLHSLIVDPRDKNHLYFGMSGGGVHESRDQGKTWNTLIDGMEVVEGFGFDIKNPMFHDPHCVRMCPSNPDRLYQQNHCGIYRIDRPGNKWTRVGKAMPKNVGDVGFPMVVHPRNDNTCWVFPMDGGGVWPRTSPEGKPAVFVTNDGGKTWKRQDKGMPRVQAWWTVKRQAMTADVRDPVGLYFGTTQGELWLSRDEGKKWECIARNLPHIYAVETAEL